MGNMLLPIFAAYQAQADVVAREKAKLRELNDRLLEARKTCQHAFKAGECERCGQNEDVFNHLVARGDRQPLVVKPWPQYQVLEEDGA